MSDSTYVAGTCNIGQKEIRRRQFVAVVGLFLSISSLIGLISVSAPTGARVGIFLPLMVASVGCEHVDDIWDDITRALDAI